MASEMGGGIGPMLEGISAPDDQAPLRPPATPAELDAAPLVILIVDDDAALRMTLQRMLAPGAFGRYIVECAQDGGEAIEHIKAHKPDLIITDIYMPVSDGF